MSPAWSQKEEDEADQFAIWLMARAGFDTNQAAQLFGTLDELNRDHRLRRTSMFTAVAGGALAGAAKTALINGGGWYNAAFGAVGGAMEAAGKQKVDHYHRNLGDRASRCANIVHVLQPEDPDEGAMLIAKNAVPIQPPPAVVVASIPSKPSRKGGKGSKLQTRVARVPLAPPPKPLTPWQVAVRRSKARLQELALSQDVRLALLKSGPAEAVKLCPEHALTNQMALSCGLAYASSKDGEKAEPLFLRALADVDADAKTFTEVAEAQDAMERYDMALKTLDMGDGKLGSPYPLTPLRIKVLARKGDVAGAKTVAKRCESEADGEVKAACRQLGRQLNA